jgi:tripartite-type tricarboxylate transporter receptor subunit TctC
LRCHRWFSPCILRYPARSVKDFIALAKANPAALTYGTGGVGTTGHIAGEVMATWQVFACCMSAYKGSGPAVQGVLGGEIASTFSTTAALIPLMKAGRLRALGVSTATRIPGLAVPTIAESGVPGYEVVLYSGVLGPANLPLPIIEKLNAALVRIVTAAEVKETYANLGVVPFSDSPQEFAAHMKSEIAKFRQSAEKCWRRVQVSVSIRRNTRMLFAHTSMKVEQHA